jgi:hypothetical protein
LLFITFTKTMVKPKKTKPSKLTKEEQFWAEVDQLAQAKIYHLFTNNIPFQNIPLITEPWKYEEAQQKKVGLFLERDADYRDLLGDVENQYYEEESQPDKETIAEEVALWYCRMVMKSLIADLSDYSSYDPAFFSDLTSNEY